MVERRRRRVRRGVRGEGRVGEVLGGLDDLGGGAGLGMAEGGGGGGGGCRSGDGIGEKLRRGLLLQEMDSLRRRWRRMNSWIGSSPLSTAVVAGFLDLDIASDLGKGARGQTVFLGIGLGSISVLIALLMKWSKTALGVYEDLTRTSIVSTLTVSLHLCSMGSSVKELPDVLTETETRAGTKEL